MHTISGPYILLTYGSHKTAFFATKYHEVELSLSKPTKI
jgi:hypothetical protein